MYLSPSSESRKLWRALQNTDTVSASRCLWSESHCRENLFPVLGIDAAQKVRRLGSGDSQSLLAVVTRITEEEKELCWFPCEQLQPVVDWLHVSEPVVR